MAYNTYKPLDEDVLITFKTKYRASVCDVCNGYISSGHEWFYSFESKQLICGTCQWKEYNEESPNSNTKNKQRD